MTDTRSPSSVSFWRQDLDWYVQQQNWIPSFFQQDCAGFDSATGTALDLLA
jgi:hypothetical protein